MQSNIICIYFQICCINFFFFRNKITTIRITSQKTKRKKEGTIKNQIRKKRKKRKERERERAEKKGEGERGREREGIEQVQELC